MKVRRGPATALAVSVAAVLLATLLPGDAADLAGADPRGSGGALFRLADAARNLALFLPLGASLAWGRVRPGTALLIGAVLSSLLETAQLALPGRYANPLDVLMNAAGTGLGVALARSAPRWLRPSAAGARRLSLLAGLLALALFLATGLLFAPVGSFSRLACHLPPAFAHVPAYQGAILGAWLDDLDLVPGPVRDPERVGALLQTDFELRVAALAASPPEQTAALLVITAPSRAVIALGVQREDLLFRYLSRSGLLGLETVRLRLPGALRGVSTGSSISLRVRRAGSDLCLAVDDAQECGLGPTLGDGWLLLAPEVPGHGVARVLGALWIAALFVPVGYWGAASRRPAVSWATAAAGLILAPALTGLLATPASQLAGGVAGLAAGASLWRVSARSAGGPHAGSRSLPR